MDKRTKLYIHGWGLDRTTQRFDAAQADQTKQGKVLIGKRYQLRVQCGLGSGDETLFTPDFTDAVTCQCTGSLDGLHGVEVADTGTRYSSATPGSGIYLLPKDHPMIRSKSLAATAVLGLVVVATASGCSSNSSGSGSSASPSANAVALTPEVQAKLQKVIDDVRVQFKAPGLQAGVWTDNGQWVGTSGVAKAGTTQTITPADHSRVGSITKTMTGTVILQLIDEGKLSFDDVIDKYVPGMPNGSIATIKNLIEMQSGIPTYTADTAVVNKYSAAPTTAFTLQELVNSVRSLLRCSLPAPGSSTRIPTSSCLAW